MAVDQDELRDELETVDEELDADDVRESIARDLAPEDDEREVEEVEPQGRTDDRHSQFAHRLTGWMTQNPDRAEELAAWERGERILVDPNAVRTPPVEAAPAQGPLPEPAPEDGVDFWSDPEGTVKALYQRVMQQDQALAAYTQANAHNHVRSGIKAFVRTHPNLSPQETNALATELMQRKLLPAFWAQDPQNPSAAVQQAMETVYRNRYFDKARGNGAQSVAKAAKAKRRAASAGGRRASVARAEPAPTNPQERHAAIAREIADAMNANR